jgi:3-oxoacyl-[acyl-carrier-protein] synthase III
VSRLGADRVRRAAQEGQIKPGQRVMYIAFGAGLTWGASLWQL